MKKIIAMIRPFDLDQILMVYEDGNKIDMINFLPLYLKMTRI